MVCGLPLGDLGVLHIALPPFWYHKSRSKEVKRADGVMRFPGMGFLCLSVPEGEWPIHLVLILRVLKLG